MVAMLVMSDLSESLRMRFCKEPREQIAHLLFKKEQMSEERRERFVLGHKKGGKL